jgi:TatD DNase family protein
MILFDTHAHFDLKSSSPEEVEAALARAYAAGVSRIVAVAGSDTPGDFSRTFDIVSRHPSVWAAAGVHPHTASELTASVLDKVRFAMDHEKTVALGEIGLDYHYNFSAPKEQRTAFIKQLRTAREARRKVVIHTREADEDTLLILRDEGAEEIGGVIHCFSAGAAFAEGVSALGFYLSFSGILTFSKADDIREIARTTPLDRILTETDSPYLSPVPHRGRKNEPALVRHVVEKLAEIKDIPKETAAAAVYRNAVRLFGLQAFETQEDVQAG